MSAPHHHPETPTMSDRLSHSESVAAFTPGPWHADKINAWNVWASDCKVAKTFDVNQADQYREPPEAERIANARLIAAAPELYEALENARDAIASLDENAFGRAGNDEHEWPIRDEMLHHIDEALNKARGVDAYLTVER